MKFRLRWRCDRGLNRSLRIQCKGSMQGFRSPILESDWRIRIPLANAENKLPAVSWTASKPTLANTRFRCSGATQGHIPLLQSERPVLKIRFTQWLQSDNRSECRHLVVTRRPLWGWATSVADIGGKKLLTHECRLSGIDLGSRYDSNGSTLGTWAGLMSDCLQPWRARGLMNCSPQSWQSIPIGQWLLCIMQIDIVYSRFQPLLSSK